MKKINQLDNSYLIYLAVLSLLDIYQAIFLVRCSFLGQLVKPINLANKLDSKRTPKLYDLAVVPTAIKVVNSWCIISNRIN